MFLQKETAGTRISWLSYSAFCSLLLLTAIHSPASGDSLVSRDSSRARERAGCSATTNEPAAARVSTAVAVNEPPGQVFDGSTTTRAAASIDGDANGGVGVLRAGSAASVAATPAVSSDSTEPFVPILLSPPIPEPIPLSWIGEARSDVSEIGCRSLCGIELNDARFSDQKKNSTTTGIANRRASCAGTKDVRLVGSWSFDALPCCAGDFSFSGSRLGFSTQKPGNSFCGAVASRIHIC